MKGYRFEKLLSVIGFFHWYSEAAKERSGTENCSEKIKIITHISRDPCYRRGYLSRDPYQGVASFPPALRVDE